MQKNQADTFPLEHLHLELLLIIIKHIGNWTYYFKLQVNKNIRNKIITGEENGKTNEFWAELYSCHFFKNKGQHSTPQNFKQLFKSAYLKYMKKGDSSITINQQKLMNALHNGNFINPKIDFNPQSDFLGFYDNYYKNPILLAQNRQDILNYFFQQVCEKIFKKSETDSKGRREIHWKAICNIFSNNESLNGYDINSTDSAGNTPIHFAAEYGHSKLVLILLSAGSEADCTNKYGQTPLWLATYNGFPDVLKILLEKCADINHSVNLKKLLYLARERGLLECVKILILAGANINEKILYRKTQ